VIAGRYTLEREIGRGGMGVVWLARDEVLGRSVALKRVGMFPGGSTPDLERAAREARIAATLNHPHVVAVFDLVTDGDEQWLVMEYVEGVTLAQLVHREGALPPDRAARIVGQAADALAAAHASGIVHRDVKPSNILLTSTGQVKLTDFGIARAVADASLTQTGLVTGSPAYLAPEIAAGHAATAASDVWSLGATLYFALAGRPPYEVGDNVLGALYRIVHEEPPRLPGAGWLATPLDSTMAKDPGERWSMSRLRDHLAAGPSAATAGVPAQPTPEHTQVLPAAPVEPAGPVPDEPGPDLGGQGDTASGVPLVLPAEPKQPRTPRERPPRDPRRRRPGTLAVLAAATVAVVLLLVLLGWLLLRDEPEPAADGGRSTPSASPTPTQSPSPSESPDEPTAGEMSAFVEDYLATAPTNPARTWRRLTPAFQDASGGFGSYRGFWSGFESATPSDVRADPEAMTVSYSVRYEEKGGGTTTDKVTLELVENDGDFLISGER
jgi:serine/threonine protein kinase